MNKYRRYARAFIAALKLTWSGNAIQPPERRYPRLFAWVREGQHLAKHTLETATANGMDQAAREAFRLQVDRRDLSMEVILQAVYHNLAREYPMLMDARIEHNLTALYAMNLNDRYRMEQLAAADLPPAIAIAVQELAAYLEQIPPSND